MINTILFSNFVDIIIFVIFEISQNDGFICFFFIGIFKYTYMNSYVDSHLDTR